MGWGEAVHISRADQECGNNNGRKEGGGQEQALAKGNDYHGKAGIGMDGSIPGSSMALKRKAPRQASSAPHWGGMAKVDRGWSRSRGRVG